MYLLQFNDIHGRVIKTKATEYFGGSGDLEYTGDCRIFAPGKQNPESVKRSLFGISSGL